MNEFKIFETRTVFVVPILRACGHLQKAEYWSKTRNVTRKYETNMCGYQYICRSELKLNHCKTEVQRIFSNIKFKFCK